MVFLLINVNGQAIYDTLLLHELEVFATIDDIKSPSKVVTIDSLQRNEMDLHDISELLATFTPVFVKSYGRGAVATVSFRGTGASHTKVVWDGFDINSPMLGQADLSTIPVSLFNNIELKYGGGSLSDVSGALGGSVLLGSKNLLNTNREISINQSFGSFNTFLTSADVTISGSNMGSQTNYSRQSSNNDFQYYNNAILPAGREMKQTNAHYALNAFTQQFDIKTGKNQIIKIITWNSWINRNIPTIMTNVLKGGNQIESLNEYFSRNIISWKYKTDNTLLEAKGAYFFENLEYNLNTIDSLGNDITNIDSKNKTNSISISLKYEKRFSNKLTLNVGTKYIDQFVNSNNYSEKKNRSISSSNISVKGDIGSKVNFEGLARIEIVDGVINPIMPLIGFSYKPFNNADFFIKTTASRNYNIPSLNDLYWYPGGNDSLLPEESLEADISFDYLINFYSHKLEFRASAYGSKVTNWIIWQPGDYRYWTPKNIARVNSNGIEISSKVSLNLKGFSSLVFIEYALTNANQVINNYAGNQLMYVPRNNLNSFVSIEKNGYYINWAVHYTGQRNTTLDPNDNWSDILPAYTINNITIGKFGEVKKVSFDIRFKVYNIFNIDYQAVLWRAMPGRNYEISFKIKI